MKDLGKLFIGTVIISAIVGFVIGLIVGLIF